MTTPRPHQMVEVLVDGKWLPATFVPADFVVQDSEDELWWMDYFVLENGTTVPDDITSGDVPPWRPA